jgi:integrase
MPKKRSHGDGALFQLSGRHKYWRGVVDIGFDQDGRRIQKAVQARTQREAKAKLDALIKEIRETGAPLDKQVTVAAWSTRWLETVAKPDVKPNTFTTYKAMVNRWIIPTLGRKKVHSLTPSDVRDLRAAIIDAGRSSSTAKQAHVVLSLILGAARAERLCATNVADDVKPPRPGKTDRDAIPTEQALAILQAASALPDSAGSRWWFKLLGGPRQGEILGATLDSLDLDAGIYRVNWKLEALPREHGCEGGDQAPSCGHKQAARCPQARWRVPDGHEHKQIRGAWHFTRPKSRTGRVVPLIPQLVEAIRRHIDATAHWPNPHGLIWRNPDGSPILPRTDGAEWRDLLETAGVIGPAENRPGGTRMTGHWARHTTVTILASLGVDMQLIGEIVGHSSTQVTEIYRHAQVAEKQAAMERLGTVWAEGLALPRGGTQPGSSSSLEAR